MSNDDFNPDEFSPDVRPAGGFGAWQFSLTGLLVLVTVSAAVMSIYVSVGRMLGMSGQEVALRALPQLLHSFPIYLVWIVGMTVALRRLRWNRRPAMLTLISLGTMTLVVFVTQLAYMALIQMNSSGQIGTIAMGWIFTLVSFVNAILHAVCWILILIAIFARREPDAPTLSHDAGMDVPRDPT